MYRTLSIAATCFAASLSVASAQSIVRVGTDVDAGTLDPRLSRDTTAYRATDLIYSGLVHLTPGLEPVPDLAESWQNPDPTTWIFKLRPNLAFSDGSPLTAEDVAFTFSTLISKDFNAPLRALYTPITAVEATDPLTVKFTLSAPYAPLLSYLDIGIVPKKAVDGGRDIGIQPIGAGPMKLVAWKRGSSIDLEANPGYWKGKPPLDKLSLRIIGDGSARAQAFEAGDIDIIQSPLAPQDIKRLQADKRFAGTVVSGLGVTYINFNTKDPLLASPKMRQAFTMLIDQQTIVNDIYQGVDKVASSILLPSSWAFAPDVKQPAFNVEGAKALFKAEGWADTNGDGILDKGGKPLTVTLSTHSEDSNRVQAVEFMQAIFQSAGVDAKTQITDWPSFSTNYVQKSQHQIALLGWLNIVDPDRLTFAQLTTGGSTNWGGYANPALDDLLKRGRSASVQGERAKAYHQAAAIIADELPYAIVSYQGYQLFASKKLPFEVQPNPRGNMRGMIGLKD
ncbi:MAG: ABC transporter substrate-binding protein [Microvirga sp.]